MDIMIYRVEGPFGDGPYVDPQCSNILSEHGFGWSAKAHPSPGRDIGIDVFSVAVEELYFACSSLEQLFSWWHNDTVNKDLSLAGANIAIYSVPDKYVMRSSKQVAFKRNKGTKIGTLTFDQANNVIYNMCM